MEEGADGDASVAGAGDGGRGGASEQAGEELPRRGPGRLRWRRCLLLLRLLLCLLWGLRSSVAVFGVVGPREVVAAQAPEEGARGVARERRRGRMDDGEKRKARVVARRARRSAELRGMCWVAR